MATTGEVIRKYRKLRGLSQRDLSTALATSERRWVRIEQDQAELRFDEAKALSQLLGISVSELAGEDDFQDLSDGWFAAWETKRKGVKVIDRHGITAEQHFDRLSLVADGDYRWHADCVLIGQSLVGSYRSVEEGKPYWGALHLHITGDVLSGHWAGKSTDGPRETGRGVLARNESVAVQLLTVWIKRGTLRL